MPEYALAVDLYTGAGPDDGRRWLYVQEYAAPHTVDPIAARRRREEALSVLPEVTGIALDHVHLRTRRRQKDGGQYEKLNRREEFHVVEEAGLKVRVNLDDYLDTGLFLDHRLTRQRLGAQSKGKRFLNLFCYTGVATLHAVAGGAGQFAQHRHCRALTWTGRAANLELNGFAAHAPTAAGRLRAAGWPSSATAGLRPDLPRSADVLEFCPHGRGARYAARSRAC